MPLKNWTDSCEIPAKLYQIERYPRIIIWLFSYSEKFVTHLDGPNLLMEVVKQFKTDVDVSCNVSR